MNEMSKTSWFVAYGRIELRSGLHSTLKLSFVLAPISLSSEDTDLDKL